MDGETVCVLLVEDEEAHAELVRRAFQPYADRMRLVVAGSLEEAKNLRTECSPDLVIADWLLPDGKGTELLPVSDEAQRVPLVMMTSRGNERVAVEAIKAGALDYVVKSPATLADMPHIVERALREWDHIAERKRAEEVLRQYATELEARNEELDAFAHTAAHDLKNPLSLVIGLAETLKLDYASLSAAEVGHYLHRLAQHALKMNNIIDELLLLAGVRQTEVKLDPLDMTSIVTGALQRLTDLTEAYRAEIVLPKAWPGALGYAPWVEEVWINYLSNALKYGGRLPHVELGAETQTDGTIRFSVRDNGPGITLEDQARLFKPFTRLDQARARGHGLGLSIVRRIVEKLGGQVGVESQPGCGSTFYFTLPKSQASKTPQE